ncbi:unnamed protein product [Phytophthora fragariaefolia]|uniref:Unnamed protein product n=1 Tax=Phytophthora fragariaefolia TaxID=1490495 RepID=A0A9W6X850_9STRA|nr:unnamed protein product [Phytophthora fragariaefolia]
MAKGFRMQSADLFVSLSALAQANHFNDYSKAKTSDVVLHSNAEELMARFPTASKGFDYTTFCKTLQQPPSLQEQQRQIGRLSPSRRKPRSPTKLQQREQARMRIDKRLESQRLLMESVRHKLIRGVVGDESDGYHGIQNALHRLDVAGEGYLDAHVFIKKFIQRLKCPLTRPEREFLLEQLRAQSTANGEDVLDYEQVISDLSSDDSLSESDTEHEQPKSPSPSKASQLGSEFLAAEKRLTEFLRTAFPATSNSSQVGDTPRSLFTGAEKFLEIAETMDPENTGLLPVEGKLSNLSPRSNTSVAHVFRSCRVFGSPVQMQSKNRFRASEWLVNECHRAPKVAKNESTATTPRPIFPNSANVSQPKVVLPDSASDLVTAAKSVGDYLMFHATPQERRNFENLMEMLQNLAKSAKDQEMASRPIDNGVMLSLGKTLRVKVQFTTEE